MSRRRSPERISPWLLSSPDLQGGEGFRDLAGGGDGNMDVVRLKDAAQVGLVRLAFAQAPEGRFLVPEGLQEGEGELSRIERLFGQGGYGLFDFDGVHFPLICASPTLSCLPANPKSSRATPPSASSGLGLHSRQHRFQHPQFFASNGIRRAARLRVPPD